MIRRVKEGYRVVARSGRNMGTYRRREDAEERLAQIEAFKHMRYQHSPTRRIRGPRIVRRHGGWSVLAKTGRSMGNYRTREEALRRKAQIEANAVKFFTKSRGRTIPEQYSPGWHDEPRLHAKAAKKGHRHHQRRYSHSPQGAWNVYLDGRKIETVYVNDNADAWQVKHSLVNHDGYPPQIEVRRRKGP